MPSLVPLVDEFHEINQHLEFWLNTLRNPTSRPDLPARPATPEQMNGLLSELMRAGERLRGLPAERNDALEHEMTRYRSQVERLHALLPSIHSGLLRERARLEQERERLNSAAQWARGSRQTL